MDDISDRNNEDLMILSKENFAAILESINKKLSPIESGNFTKKSLGSNIKKD